MTYIRNLLFTGILALVCFSFIKAEEWYLFENNMCKISFPVKPDSDTTQVDLEFGKITLLTHMYEPAESLDDSNLVYGLMETEYPESYVKMDTKKLEDQFFRGAVDGSVKKSAGKLLSEKK